jgi:ATP-binding cassette, subfamily B, bacterial
MSDRRARDLALLWRVARQARPYWPHIALTFVVSLLAAPLALLTPVPLKIVVDNALGGAPLPPILAWLVPGSLESSREAALGIAVGLVVLVALLVHLQGLVVWLLQTWTGERLVLEFRARLFDNVQRLSLSYHDTRGTTESLYRIQYDADGIQHVALGGTIPFVTAAVTLTAMISVVARLDGALALVALGISPVLFLLTGAAGERLRRRWHEFKDVESRAMSVVNEALTSVRVVKAFGREDHEHGRFVRRAAAMLKGHIALARVTAGFELLVGLTIALGTAAVLLIGVRHVAAGSLTLGDLLVVMGYLTQLYVPLQTISKKIADLQSGLASADRAFALLDEPPDVSERPGASPLGRAKGAVELRDVAFSYAEGRRALQGISFAVEPGTRVGIVGTSGAGKTTLVSLLTRFYDPSGGQVFLDGVDLRDWRLRDLRDQFAIVLQDPVLFSTTLAENIAYGRPEATREEIVAAARAAHAHEFIERLPDGYATQVGERGMRLSGGERQRISLARAFLKDAPILILDEPTSSVDPATEALVIDALEHLMADRTTFIIAHRSTTVTGCDVLLRIDNGRLVDMTWADATEALAADAR